MKQNTILVGAIALLLLLSSGCAANPPATPTAGAPATATPEATPVTAPATNPNATAPASEVAAIVNGQAIPMATYQAQLQTAIASYSAQSGVDWKSEAGQAALASLQDQVLDWLIDQVLIDQAAAREGIKVNDAQVDAEVERIKSQNPNGFAEWLKANGFTEESFRAQIRSDLLGAALRDRVTQDIGGKVEQVHIRHILVDTEKEARSLLEKLRQGKATFEALAKQESKDDTTAAQGGDFGFVPRGVLAESVEKVAFALEPGQISEPVHSPLGWHLVQVLERDPAREISPEMLAALRQQAFMRWLEGERQRAKIERFVPENGDNP